ncbi:MAG: hypothetical protein WAV82_02400, partial [Methylobacter sp.]
YRLNLAHSTTVILGFNRATFVAIDMQFCNGCGKKQPQGGAAPSHINPCTFLGIERQKIFRITLPIIFLYCRKQDFFALGFGFIKAIYNLHFVLSGVWGLKKNQCVSTSRLVTIL